MCVHLVELKKKHPRQLCQKASSSIPYLYIWADLSCLLYFPARYSLRILGFSVAPDMTTNCGPSPKNKGSPWRFHTVWIQEWRACSYMHVSPINSDRVIEEYSNPFRKWYVYAYPTQIWLRTAFSGVSRYKRSRRLPA